MSISIADFVIISTIISTTAFVVGERLMLARRQERRRVIIMAIDARSTEKNHRAHGQN